MTSCIEPYGVTNKRRENKRDKKRKREEAAEAAGAELAGTATATAVGAVEEGIDSNSCAKVVASAGERGRKEQSTPQPSPPPPPPPSSAAANTAAAAATLTSHQQHQQRVWLLSALLTPLAKWQCTNKKGRDVPLTSVVLKDGKLQAWVEVSGRGCSCGERAWVLLR